MLLSLLLLLLLSSSFPSLARALTAEFVVDLVRLPYSMRSTLSLLSVLCLKLGDHLWGESSSRPRSQTLMIILCPRDKLVKNVLQCELVRKLARDEVIVWLRLI